MKSETVSIRLTTEEKELLKKIAAEKDISISKLIHNIIFKEYDLTSKYRS